MLGPIWDHTLCTLLNDLHRQGIVEELDIDRVEVEDHPVIDGHFGDVANNFGELLSGDISADGIGIGIPRRAPCSVGG